MQFGPTMRMPCLRTLSVKLLCGPSSAPAFGEAGGDHDQRLDSGGGAVVDDVEHSRRRDGDDGEVDAGGQVRAEAYTFSPAISSARVLTG